MSVEAFALSFFDPDRDLYGTARSGATLLFHGRQPAAHDGGRLEGGHLLKQPARYAGVTASSL